MCDCGSDHELRFRSWGTTQSCGCLQREKAEEGRHNATSRKGGKTRLYRIWSGMRERCSNPNRKEWHNYGGRGISVCGEWEDFVVFRDWAQENGYADDLDLDRIDNDGDYEPENCRWVTRSENLRNTRRSAEATAFGETKCIADWVDDDRCVVPDVTLRTRLRRSWHPEDALTLPSGSRNARKIDT